MAEEIESTEDNEIESTEENIEGKTRRGTIVDQLASEVIGENFEIATIVVCNPEEKAENKGLTKWVEYKTITETPNGDQMEVSRRYNHFLWLRKLLLQDYKGVVVPPLPEKKNFGRFEASFIERRRRRLEVFLNRVAGHTLLKDANAFRVFLCVQESEMFGQALKGDSSTYGEKASSLYNSYRKQKQRVVQSWSKDVELSEEDAECQRIKAYGTNLETIARQLEQCFLNLDNDLRAQGMLWTNTAENLAALSNFEEEEGENSTAATLRAFEETCTKVSSLSENPEALSTFTTIKLRDLFDDVSKYGRSIKECCIGRDELFYQNKAEIATLESNKTKLEGLEVSKYTYSKEKRIEATKTAIADSEVAVEVSTESLEEVTQRLQAEFKEFSTSKPNRVEERVVSFAEYQIEHLTEMVQYWRELKESIEQAD